jgi:hypothetical protein
MSEFSITFGILTKIFCLRMLTRMTDESDSCDKAGIWVEESAKCIMIININVIGDSDML